MSTLSIIATPIGNLEDISARALRILGEVDLILSEDTRVTKKLLDHFDIQKPLLSYHHHSAEKRLQEILALLREGKSLALVSDAGTPGINDPGGRLIERMVAQFGSAVSITPIPGPSAVTSSLSISGFPADQFVYVGFPPHRKGREKFFREVATEDRTVVFLESPHRIRKALASLEKLIPDRPIMVGRELTKIHETIYRGTVREVTAELNRGTIRGEFAVVVRKKSSRYETVEK